jgi:hypothetical protein
MLVSMLPDAHSQPHVLEVTTYSLYTMLACFRTMPVLVLPLLQVTAKDAEISRLNNDVDSLGLELGRARGELAKQVGGQVFCRLACWFVVTSVLS